MKIAYTSDLHYPMTSAEDITNMIVLLKKERPDVIVLGGDIGECVKDPNRFEYCIKLFRDKFNIPILVLAGNHDIWCNPNSKYDSLYLFYEKLPEICKNLDCVWLENEICQFGKVAIVGSYVHYDFSARETIGPAAMPIEYFEVNAKNILNDARYMKGIDSNVEFAKKIGGPFQDRIRKAQNDNLVSEIIVCSHVPLTEQQMTRKPYDFNWAIATPFFGNFSHLKVLTQCQKISHILSGHSHQSQEGIFEQIGSTAYALTLGADYRKPIYRIIESIIES